MSTKIIAGAASADITPDGSQFLFGYPHVRRYSTGVHDPLLSSALYLCDGTTSLLWVANDVIYISRATAQRVRERIETETGIPASNIMITATHTHSGPLTVDVLCCESDPVVPETDPHYIEQLEGGIVRAAIRAFQNARPAEIGLTIADGSCVGGNRHDSGGPSNPEVPVLVVRDEKNRIPLAAMLVCSMHPTVLHEDSTLISGDFPAMTRQYLQKTIFGDNCPVLHHTGPCGNQSPRHVTRSNTFDEAARLGRLLGQSVAEAVQAIDYVGDLVLRCNRNWVDLPARKYPTVEFAEEQLVRAASRLDYLRKSAADPREIRTAECDWFGAEELAVLARASAAGRLQKAVDSVMPAEVQLMRVGTWAFVGWPGEAFVEFALQAKTAHRNCHIISMANGELQGYLVTEEAVRWHWYEANNSLFASPQAGMALLDASLTLLDNHATSRLV